ncbi:hypothetical protein BsWGS_10283 [Bradybaena similaris]
MSCLANSALLVSLLVAIHATEGRSPTNTLLGVCDRHWELVYKQDEFGNGTFGSKQELMELAMTGTYIKANLYMPDHVLQLPADSVSKYNGELCVQSLRSLAHNGTHVDTSDPWLYFIVCTTGHVTERDVFNSSVFRVSIDWYIKDIATDNQPIYSNFVDGTPLEPSKVLRLHEAAKRMNMFGSMRDRAYVFPFHNVNLDPETGEVVGQNILHIGQRYQENYVTFNDLPYKWFSAWSNLGYRDNARWSLQFHNPYAHNVDNAALDWYADVCWRLIYAHDGNGYADFGSVDDLIAAVESGHRVRVRYEDVALEVSNIRVKEGVVAAQILNEVTRVGGIEKDRYYIAPDTRVKFSIVHTTGKVNTYEYLVGSPEKRIKPPKRRPVEWMIDTRPWSIVFKTSDPPGDLLRGSVLELRNAVMSGASIRLMLQFDPLEGAFYTQANNIRNDMLTDTIYAQALDHVSDMKSKVLKEYELQKSIFNWYLQVSSKGHVRMTAFNFGTDVFRYDDGAKEAIVTWFANL